MHTINAPSISSYASFRRDALLPNVPVLLPASVSSSWACLSAPSHSFTAHKQPDRSSPAPAYDTIHSNFGDLPISVTDCAAACDQADSADVGLPRELSELVALWAEGGGRSLYLKDWHLPRMLAERARSVAKELYTVPAEWEDDWLNAYWASEKADDFRFVVSRHLVHHSGLHRLVRVRGLTSVCLRSLILAVPRWG